MPKSLKDLLVERVSIPKLPARPAAFEPDPQILGGGDPLFARAVRGLMASNPELKKKVGKIQIGPTEGVGNVLAFQRKRTLEGLPEGLEQFIFPQISDYPRTNLAGLFSMDSKDISINPSLGMSYMNAPHSRASQLQTLVHELAHAKGETEAGAGRAEELLEPSHDAAIETLRANKPLRYYLRTGKDDAK